MICNYSRPILSKTPLLIYLLLFLCSSLSHGQTSNGAYLSSEAFTYFDNGIKFSNSITIHFKLPIFENFEENNTRSITHIKHEFESLYKFYDYVLSSVKWSLTY